MVRDIEQKSFGGELPQNKFCGDNPERFPERPGRPVAFDQIFLSNLFDNSRAFSRVLACCSKSWEGTPKKKSCVTGQLFARLACVLGVVWRPTWRRRFKRPNFFLYFLTAHLSVVKIALQNGTAARISMDATRRPVGRWSFYFLLCKVQIRLTTPTFFYQKRFDSQKK